MKVVETEVKVKKPSRRCIRRNRKWRKIRI